MKKIAVFIMLFSMVLAHAQDEMPEMPTQLDSLSYFLGLGLGFELQNPPFQANQELILRGFTEALLNVAPVDRATSRQVFQELQMALQEAERKEAEKEALAARDAGMAWLAENGKKEGVHTTASGLQYEVMVEGDGSMPADTSTVKVHYEGKLTDGTIFDSSYERGEPITFPLNRVIPGWTEGLQLMKVGSTHMLYIPPELGYGSRNTGAIPPNSVLVFKVELLGIE